MLTYSFANIGSDSLYRHLYKCIKNDIINHEIKSGEKLPSKRSLAKNLGISIITVESAYAELMAEGYIYSIPKKGFYAADLISLEPKSAEIQEQKSITLSSRKNDYIADFTNNQTDSTNFPFSTWAKLVREILNENQSELMMNSPCGGIIELRTAIAKHLRDFRNIHVEPEQIIVGAGTEYLYGLLIQLLGYEKRYAVEDPGYHKIAKIYKKHNVHCDYVSMDHSGIKVDELDNLQTDVIHISPSHHFPTGRIMPISRRYELLGWAAKSKSRYIIEDDYDSEFRMNGNPIPSMQTIDVLEKVIYMNTFSKTLASTVRISYMVLPKHLVTKFYHEMSFYSCTVSNFEQYTLSHFINEGYFEKHINRMRKYYHTKRDFLLNEIKNSSLSSYVQVLEEDAGLHFIVHIKTSLTDEEFCQKAELCGVHIAALSTFYHDVTKSSEHYFIVNYSSTSETAMRDAIQIISKKIVR